MDSDQRDKEQLQQALAARSAQLQAVNKDFEQFAYSVSHDLRAPLRALEGFSKILLEDYGEKLDSEGKRCLEILVGSAHKASVMIEDLLVVSRLARRPYAPTMMNMEDITNECIKVLPVKPGEVHFKVHPMPQAWGDVGLTTEIVQRLLENAVKFSRKKSDSRIEIGGGVDGEKNVFWIRDNGVGFDMKYVGRLFGVFQRLHSDQEYDGRGIGLAVVQRLARRQGGEVQAEGKLGEGATFTFSLPAHKLPDDTL
ncbi:MAG: multi-sensor signal transduction histidine kinase [Verrucomicrobiales bacterium]|nr:multi-sensor signal transduction histidine kinase [Verrucomicrobiales bacterium]